MAVVTEPTQVALRTVSLGDLVLSNVEAINEENLYDRVAHRTPFSKQTWVEGSGNLLPVTLEIEYRVRGASMTDADAIRARVLEADADGITELIWIDRSRPVRGLTNRLLETPQYLGYASRFSLSASDADWVLFTGSLNAWTGS